jgi:hypothetical protein
MSSDARARLRAFTSMLLAAALIAVLVVPAALGAGYGRGKFSGQGKSQFDKDRPATPVTIKVKGKRARVLEMAFVFDCASDGSVKRLTVATPFFKVTNGPAGGGAYFTGSAVPAEGGPALDVNLNLGLRQKNIRGTADATADVDGLPCMDDVIFNAKKK